MNSITRNKARRTLVDSEAPTLSTPRPQDGPDFPFERFVDVNAFIGTEMEVRLSGYTTRIKVESTLENEGVRLVLTPFMYIEIPPGLAQKLRADLVRKLTTEYPYVKPTPRPKPTTTKKRGAPPYQHPRSPHTRS